MAVSKEQSSRAGTTTAVASQQPQGLEFLAQINGPAFEAMQAIHHRALSQMTEANAAWMRFVQRRFESDLELPANLARCQTPQEWVSVYAQFFQTALQHYQEELAEVARLGQAFGNEAADIVRAKAEEAERRLATH
jgi:hypothetical protein